MHQGVEFFVSEALRLTYMYAQIQNFSLSYTPNPIKMSGIIRGRVGMEKEQRSMVSKGRGWKRN
jgi:hypothetical protein